VRVNASERDEITASVAAHADLGPRYDSAVAEGLVERIGEEIDKRIDARIGGPQQPPRVPRGATSVRPHPGPPAYQEPAYQDLAAYQGPAAPTPMMPAASAAPAPRRASGLSGVILGLGSMGLGVGATAVVVSHHVESVAALLMVALIWAMIAVINIAHAQRRQ
jgi:hypothetical protein